MIVNDLNVVRVIVSPDKTKTPLIINADAVLPFSMASEGFQVVARRQFKIIQRNRRMQQIKFPACTVLHIGRQFPRTLEIK